MAPLRCMKLLFAWTDVLSIYPGAERFKPNPNEGRVAELEMLQEYLKDALVKLDSQIEGKVAPLERMKKLLTAKDKRATLLEMAGEHTS